MTTQDDVIDLYSRYVNRGTARLATLTASPVWDRAEGNHVYSASGERFLSCGGFSVFTLGHQHPDVVEPVTEQLRKLALVGPTVLHEAHALAARTLVEATPDGLDYAFLLSTGAEATELALKLARLNGKRRVVATVGGYHGKTLGALSVTGRDQLRTPFEPMLPDVTFVPFGDIGAMEQAVTADSCVVIEPVQGEGGVQVPPPGYFAALARLCADTGALLIVDEIQTGVGRLGRMWGVEAEDIVPDMLLSGKALGGGVIPASAVVAKASVYEPLNRDPILHTTTHGGNPLAATAIRHTIDAVIRHRVPERAAELGQRLLTMLRDTFEAHCPHLVREVRGRGLLMGVEFVEIGHAGDLVLELLDRGVVVSSAINSYGTIRFTPSAFFAEDDIRWLREAVDESARALAKRHPAHQS
ncbi:hypothetical protein ALI22I_00740 [Saccharothrix sp. ALI-22-I]|uniref:aspartate aminotransferase family protein n=1 Tax=Saccharothrix sp. ALI-22-I TaxID=1933778 RepID=UPI00097BC3EF|nr:aminotransferase class III-fold pyridoxal phosphate-dependent enzyme [Saccharothrix sp. ALI-22-I]ONI92993.1 hypothetical protein ALI22I_00740 [Saccharothrix sp. ALI-22-I]